MSFNDILVEAGGFGTYQKILTFVCLPLSLILASFSIWAQIFILLTPRHRCKYFDNDTQWIHTIGSDEEGTGACSFKNGDNFTACTNGYVYDFTTTFPTYASENNLVCEDAWKMYFAHTVYWIGTIFGTLSFGILNDKYGRRRAYQITNAMTLAADVVTYFSSHHVIFLIARFFSSAGTGSLPTVTYILVIENSIPSKRRLTIFVWSFAFALGSLSIVWIAYLVYNWRYLLMITWIPPSIGLILSFFFQESPSWLMMKGRIEEAIANIERMARINGKALKRDFIKHHIEMSIEKDGKVHGKNGSISNTVEKINSENNGKLHERIKTISHSIEKKDSEKNGVNETGMSCFQAIKCVLKSPNLRKRILCLAVLWMTSCVCYNGNILALQYLPFNMYITYSIGAIIELPGCFLVIFTIDRFGRRWVNSSMFIVGGVLGIVSANLTAKHVIFILVIIIRMCYSAAFDVTFSVSSELIPTEIRGRTISFIRTCGGIGSASAPFIVSLAQKDPLLPLACFGIVAVIAGLLMLTLPETAHQHLPHTIEEGENFGTDQSFCFCPFIQNKPAKEDKENSNFVSSGRNVREMEKIQNECVCLSIHKLPMD